MDFADSPEHAAFRAEFRHWLEEHLPPEICVDDAADQRVAPDRETLGKRIAWQKKMHAAGWVGISWPRDIAVAAPALCSRSFSTRNIFVPAPRSCRRQAR